MSEISINKQTIKPYICSVCGYLYDIESADKDIEGNFIPFEELEPNWVCPNCGVKSKLFIPTKSNRPPDIPSS